MNKDTNKLNNRNIPINKGNYSMDTQFREQKFEINRGFGWEDKYLEYRKEWEELPKKLKVRDYPLLVDLELASICNLKCPMCYTISKEFKQSINSSSNPYGDGKSSKRILEIVLSTKINDSLLIKRITS